METPAITYAAMSGSSTARLQWTASTGAAGYDVYRSNSLNGTYRWIKRVTSNSTYNYNLAVNTSYYYKVQAYRMYSTKVCTAKSYASPMVRYQAPVFTTLRQNSTNNAYLAWSSVPGAQGYQLSRSTSLNGTYSFVKNVTGTNTFNNNLTPGQLYYYKVKSFTYSGSSKVYGAISSPGSLRILATPVITSAVAYNSSTAAISWGAVTGAAGYSLYRCTTANGTFTWTKSVTTTSTYNYNLSAGTHYYKVAAYVLNGSTKILSNKSTAASVTLSNDVTYRALVIGNWDFPGTSQDRPMDDSARNVRAMLSYCNMGGSSYNITTRYNLSASGIRAAIPSAFAGADDNDVSLFYIGTHGWLGTGSDSGSLEGADGSKLLPTQLRDTLNQVRGTIIVFVDSCGSGALIKSADGSSGDADVFSKSDASSFNSAIISAFSGITVKTGELRASKYKVLTACAYNTYSYANWPEYPQPYIPAYNGWTYFSKGLCLAGGSNLETLTTLRGDTNHDSIVTLQEAYVYTKNYCNSINNTYSGIPPEDMIVQVYPANSSYPLFRR